VSGKQKKWSEIEKRRSGSAGRGEWSGAGSGSRAERRETGSESREAEKVERDRKAAQNSAGSGLEVLIWIL